VLASGGGLPWWGLPALLGYLAAALAPRDHARLGGAALWVGLVAHVLFLMSDIGSVGVHGSALRLGFGPVLSLTVCLVVAVHAVESRLVPLPRVRRALALAGGVAVALALLFPGEVRILESRWAPMHWLLGVAAYGLFGAAVLHGLLLDESERRLRHQRMAAAQAGHAGMPLLQLERLTFRFVQAGFAVLTVAIVLGLVTAERWRFDHKTVLSLAAWGVFAALLIGRHWHGWRGRQATRWLYAGALVLLLAYAGTRFVTVVLLGRGY
jgi:ABC-type uncharacterized transport system permease subunit